MLLVNMFVQPDNASFSGQSLQYISDFNLTLNKLKMKACLIIYIWDQFMIFVVSPPPSLWMKNLTRSQLHHSARIDTVTCDGESRRRPPVSPPRWPSLSPPWWPSFSQYKSRATFCDGESNGNSRRQPPQQARSQPALPAPYTIILWDKIQCWNCNITTNSCLEPTNRLKLQTSKQFDKIVLQQYFPVIWNERQRPVERGQDGNIWYSPHQVKTIKAVRKDLDKGWVLWF